jgi:hypothetical protein
LQIGVAQSERVRSHRFGPGECGWRQAGARLILRSLTPEAYRAALTRTQRREPDGVQDERLRAWHVTM